MDEANRFGTMTYEGWKDSLTRVLRRFSETEYQARVWLRGDGPEVDSYEEAVTALDDYDFNSFVECSRRSDLLTDAKVAELYKFKQSLGEFDRSVVSGLFARPEHFLDPKWSAVVAAAKEAEAALSC